MRSLICSSRLPWIPVIVAILAAVASGANGAGNEYSSPPSAFAVEVHGEGQPVFLIPGLGSPGSVWDETVEALVAEGYQAHVFTLAGFAGQPPMQLDGEKDFLTAVRDALATYARGLVSTRDSDDRPALVGHSLGGTLSLWLAASHPDLFGPVVAVDGVAVLPALRNPDATEESTRATAVRMAATYRGMTPEAYDTQTSYALSTMITDPAVVRQVAEAARGTDPATAAAAMSALLTRDLRDELTAIEVPVLLLAAGASAPTQEAADALRSRYESQVAAVPDHRVEVVADARHFIMLDQPERFLGFLLTQLASHDTNQAREATR